MKATNLSGDLTILKDCYILIPNTQFRNITGSPNIKIFINNLPDISDSKSASYADETVIGRSSPIKTYSQSDNRSISIQLHFYVTKPFDVSVNLTNLRAIQSALYPREGDGGAPFVPPPVCKLKCGKLLSEGELCVILKSYSVKYPTEVAWVEQNGVYLPVKFDIDTTWEVVYASSELPGQERIFLLGA